MYTLGIMLEELIDTPAENMGCDHSEELMGFAVELSPFSSADYLKLLQTTFESFYNQSNMIPGNYHWLLNNIKDPDLKSIVLKLL